MGGELRAIVTTDALELGIDIGELDAALVVTFPGTVASLQADVGACGAPGARPGGLPRRRGRARPVLLPPPRGVPRSRGGGRDPRSREPADLQTAPALRRARGAALARGRRVPRPALGGGRRAARDRGRPAPPLGRRDGRVLRAAPCRRTTPRAMSRCARPRRRASRSWTSPRASCSARPRRPGRTRRSTRARSTCTSAAPTRSASSTSSADARSSRPSRATGTRSPSAPPTRRS